MKDLHRLYSHYLQFGRWQEIAALFSEDAILLDGEELAEGQQAIAFHLKTLWGGDTSGLRPGAVVAELIDEPVVTLSADGTRAQARLLGLSFYGDGDGATRISGGVYENTYTRPGGVWRIQEQRHFPQFIGDHAHGWTNVNGAELPVVPFHFSAEQAGTPIPPAEGQAQRSESSFQDLERRILILNNADDVRNLQNVLGYYMDRRMWDDVVDLFAEDCAIQTSPSTIHRGKAGVRCALEETGPAGLRYGQLNDRPIFDTIIEVDAGGAEAFSRGIELGMLGDASAGEASWEITVFRNRFVKEGDLWKLKEVRLLPLLRADYFEGWGRNELSDPRGAGTPAFIGVDRASLIGVEIVDQPVIYGDTITGAILPPQSGDDTPPTGELLAAARTRLARSLAYDAVENVSSAYGYYIDDFQWPAMVALFAEHGHKQSPFAGYYRGRDRIEESVTTLWGTPPDTRPGISYHWRTQPVIHVSADARSALLRTRLFQPRTWKNPSRPGEFYAAGFHAGMYPNDQAVFEDGVWKLWSLTIDEPYFTSVDWKGGWSSVQPLPPGQKPFQNPLLHKLPPDILLTELGDRAEHFRGGTGEVVEWPGILPMWFHYPNPVTGRLPERYWPDCVPGELRPDMRMTAHGYQMPQVPAPRDDAQSRHAGRTTTRRPRVDSRAPAS